MNVTRTLESHSTTFRFISFFGLLAKPALLCSLIRAMVNMDPSLWEVWAKMSALTLKAAHEDRYVGPWLSWHSQMPQCHNKWGICCVVWGKVLKSLRTLSYLWYFSATAAPTAAGDSLCTTAVKGTLLKSSLCSSRTNVCVKTVVICNKDNSKSEASWIAERWNINN